MELQEALKKGTIIDVRSYQEFIAGSVVDAKNFPLNEITAHIEELKSFAEPLVLCCASGNRSGMATNLLINEGLTRFIHEFNFEAILGTRHEGI